MGALELKSDIHKMIDGIQNEQRLQILNYFLKARASNQPGNHWNSLTEEQRREVLLAVEESEDNSNFTNRDEIFKKT